MKKLNLADILIATHGKVLSTADKEFRGIGTDTRLDLTGQFFIALKGDAYDAHDFLTEAVRKGASGLLVHQWDDKWKAFDRQVTIVQVQDTLQGLQDIAHFEREKTAAVVVGITGSNGKTTSKEFSAAVTATQRTVHFSKGSFNNHWGVPLTLLSEPEGTEVLLAEMGMNHAGELTRLCEIADPDVVVVTTVGRAHIEHFGSIEKIAEAKNEIYEGSRPDAIRIYNLDNPACLKMAKQASSKFPKAEKILTFSSEQSSADIYLKLKAVTMGALVIEGHIAGVQGEASVPVFGSHNLTNVMVAASIALACRMTPEQIWQALPKCQTNWGRNQLVKTKKGSEILFDGYNANPDSMAALIENLKLIQTPGKKVGVFGEMLELGEHASEEHHELGRQVGAAGFDYVYFFGSHAPDFEAGARSVGFSKNLMISNDYQDSLATELARVLSTGDIALVKGSRGMKLERFVLACDPIDFAKK